MKDGKIFFTLYFTYFCRYRIVNVDPVELFLFLNAQQQSAFSSTFMFRMYNITASIRIVDGKYLLILILIS